MLLELSHIYKSFGVTPILEDICLSVEEEDRIGLLGVNGAGKSTLLSILTGDLPCDSGDISLARGAQIGYLRQNGALNPGNTIGEEAASVFAEVHAMGARLDELRNALATHPEGAEHHALLSEYDALNAQFEHRDGYTLDVKINTVLGGMGFADYDRAMPVGKLSGGEKTRLALAKLLLGNPQLLILDEPTNHLDFVTLGWLEDYLRGYKGALVVVSHDRYFLDRVVTNICELERRKLTRYKGGYSQFKHLKEERLDYLEKQYERQQKEIARLEDYVARNIVRATTANMAKSRIHMLEHMERIEKPPGELRTTRLRFAIDQEPWKDVLKAEDVEVSVGEGAARKELCRGIALHIEKGEKIAVIGQNGVGKSSLLKSLQNLLPCRGRVNWGSNVKISYFEQENRQLHPHKTVLGEVHDRFPRKTELELRTLLGSLLFSGDDIYKKVGELSGGERAKIAFALILLERSNVLILDEPTNHLDYKTKEVLEEALCEYPGTLLMVSHDRYLLNRVPSRILEMFPDRMDSYDGGYDYYIEHRKAPQAAPRVKPERPTAENPFYRSKLQRSEQAKRKARIAALEKEIESLDEEIAALECSMTQPEVSGDYQKLQEVCAALEENRRLQAARMDEWAALCEESGE